MKLLQRCFFILTFAAATLLAILNFNKEWTLSLFEPRERGKSDLGLEWSEKPSKKKCEPSTSIIFVKTHKTGGSSIKKLLQRYVEAHDVKPNLYKQVEVLPGPYLGGYPGHFKTQFAYKECGNNTATGHEKCSGVSTVIGHIRFNKDEILSLVAKGARTRYFTVLRDPLRQVESAFYYYYRKYRAFATEAEIENPYRPLFSRRLACHPEPFLSVTKSLGKSFPDFIRMAEKSLTVDVPWFYRSRNSQSFDLGLDPLRRTRDYVLEKAEELDAVFDLVLIAEYYMESLILLKDMLCMDWKDLLLPHVNSGMYEPHDYTREEIDSLRSFNEQDTLLYDYFNRTLWRKVHAYGRRRMEKDKTRLERLFKKHNHRVNVQNTTLRGLEPLGIETPRTAGRDVHVKKISEWINDQIGSELTQPLVSELAEYMFDNGGWCPHRH